MQTSGHIRPIGPTACHYAQLHDGLRNYRIDKNEVFLPRDFERKWRIDLIVKKMGIIISGCGNCTAKILQFVCKCA